MSSIIPCSSASNSFRKAIKSSFADSSPKSFLNPKSVKGFIAKGFGTKSLSDSVISKIELNGGFSVLFTKDEVAMREFVDVILNTQEKELFYTGVDLIKANDGKVLQEAFGEYLAKNGPTIEAGLAKSTNPEVKSAYQKFLKGVNNQLNPVTGKGLIPAFVSSQSPESGVNPS